MITPRKILSRVFIVKVDEYTFKVPGPICLAAFVYHSIANRISSQFAKKRGFIPSRCDFRVIGSYVR